MRADEYSLCIKALLPITPSEKMASELKERINKLKHSPREQKDIRRDYADLSKIFHNGILNGTKSCKSIKNRNAVMSNNPSLGSIRSSNKKQIDYLEERKNIRKLNANVSSPPSTRLPMICTKWRSDLHNKKLSPNQKRELLITKAKMIDDIAERNEELLNVKNDNDPDLNQKVNFMILDSIKAKIAAFDELI